MPCSATESDWKKFFSTIKNWFKEATGEERKKMVRLLKKIKGDN